MKNVWALVRREILSYFSSPIAYVVLSAFLWLYGFYFYAYLEAFIDPRTVAPGAVVNVNQDMLRWVFHTTAFFLLFLLPMVTMRSFSEELRSGTIELLFTSPLTDTQIVMGKFLGALSLFAVMLATTSFHMAVLFYFGDPEWKPIAVGYLGLFLLGAGYIAFGLMFSALTKNQIVAGLLSFGAFVLLYLVALGEDRGWMELVTYLSVDQHLEEFAKGVLDTRDVVYFASMTILGLFLTKQAIESYRWRS